MKILTIVAARGGSRGVKNKNIKQLLGKPLIAYTLEQVIKWGGYDKFIVSTDSKDIADIAKQYDVDIPFMRPAELAGDQTGKLDVLRHALLESEQYYGEKFDTVFDLDVTSPVRTTKDIYNIVDVFKNKKPDCVFSVVKAKKNPYFNIVEKQSDGTFSVCKKTSEGIVTRQSAPEVFEMNASMYIYDRKFLLDDKNKNPYSKRAYAYEMGEMSTVDIDTEIDFKFIEFLSKEGRIEL